MAEIDKTNVAKEGDINPELGDSIPNHWLDQASVELKAGFREVQIMRGGELTTIHIFHPSVGDEMSLSQIYTRKYNELFKDDGYMTRKELKKKLIERGAINLEDDKKINTINDSMRKVIEEINLLMVENQIPPKKRIEKLKKKYYELRDELFEITRTQTEHYINCIENIAEQEQTFAKMAMCIKDKDNKPIWDSVETLYKETDRAFVNNLITEASLYWNGLSREVLDDLPGVIESLHRGETSENLPENNGS